MHTVCISSWDRRCRGLWRWSKGPTTGSAYISNYEYSHNTCQSNAHLPCLQLGPSVPELVALVQGSGDGEAQLSREYGGTGGDGFQGGAVPLYIAIGNVRLSETSRCC